MKVIQPPAISTIKTLGERFPFCEVFHGSRQQGLRQVKLQISPDRAMRRSSSQAMLVTVATAVQTSLLFLRIAFSFARSSGRWSEAGVASIVYCIKINATPVLSRRQVALMERKTPAAAVVTKPRRHGQFHHLLQAIDRNTRHSYAQPLH